MEAIASGNEISMKCDGHNHNLVEILDSRHSWDESYQVARWCEDCGAIVVDLDYDNRTLPGKYMEMRFPLFLKRLKTK